MLGSLFGANIFQKVTRMCKDKLSFISMKQESKMIQVYLIVRPTSQSKIYKVGHNWTSNIEWKSYWQRINEVL